MVSDVAGATREADGACCVWLRVKEVVAKPTLYAKPVRFYKVSNASKRSLGTLFSWSVPLTPTARWMVSTGARLVWPQSGRDNRRRLA